MSQNSQKKINKETGKFFKKDKKKIKKIHKKN